MLVATLIMGIAVVGMLSSIGTATRNASRLMERDRAVLLARAKMNELLADKRLPRDLVVNGEFDPAQTGGHTAGWRARASLFERPPRFMPGSLALERIQLEVWWMAGVERRAFTLDSFRSRVLLMDDFPKLDTGGAQ
jgi:general secretion pathway protein I